MQRDNTGMVDKINLNETPTGKQNSERRFYYNLKDM